MKKLALSLLALLTLAGCAYFKKDEGPAFICPQIGLVEQADRMALMTGSEVAVNGIISNYRGACKPNKSKSSVDFDIEVDFSASKGPAATGLKEQSFPYFIALLAPDETILQRQAFTTTVEFTDTGAGLKTEQHHIGLPLENLSNAKDYKVVIGYALTPEQLEFNHAKAAEAQPAIPAVAPKDPVKK